LQTFRVARGCQQAAQDVLGLGARLAPRREARGYLSERDRSGLPYGVGVSRAGSSRQRTDHVPLLCGDYCLGECVRGCRPDGFVGIEHEHC
jgi:hypothetical protein